MALGEKTNQQSWSRPDTEYRPTVYGYSFINLDAFEQSRIAFSMWSGTLKISISLKDEGKSGDSVKFDVKHDIPIYLREQSAYGLLQLLKAFKNDPDTYSGNAIMTAKGMIGVYKASVFMPDASEDQACLCIHLFDDNKQIVSSAAYVFANKLSYVHSDGVANYEPIENTIAPTPEIDLMILQIQKYLDASTFAESYAITDTLRKSINAIWKLEEKIVGSNSSGNSARTFNKRSIGGVPIENNSKPPQQTSNIGNTKNVSVDDLL